MSPDGLGDSASGPGEPGQRRSVRPPSMTWETEPVVLINGLAQQSPWLDWVMLALSQSSSLVVPGLLLGGYWIWCNRREALIGGGTLTLLILLSDWVGAQVKHLVGRERPCQVLDSLHTLAACGGTGSFPSNHAINTAAAAMFLHVLYPRSGWVSWPIVVLVGVSRLYLGAHYVTDVLGGWVIGSMAGAGAALLLLRRPVFRGPGPKHADVVGQKGSP